MSQFTRRTVLRLLLTVVIAVSASFAGASDKCFMWEAKAGKATVYILGSVHMGKKEMYPLDKTITDAFDSSDCIVLELDPSPEKMMAHQVKLLSLAMYQGSTLKDNISAANYTKLTEHMKKRSMPIQILQMARPWFVAMTVEILEYQHLGFSEALGIETQLMSKKGSKTVIELETIDEQLAVLAYGTDEEQEHRLESTLKKLPELKELMDKMIKAWSKGDAAAFEKLITESFPKDKKFEKFKKMMLDDRNVKMADKIAKYKTTDKTYFVAVGGAHLVGKKGIIELLKSKGFTIKQSSKTSK